MDTHNTCLIYEMKDKLTQACLFHWWQDKALEAMDKGDSPVESNDSDSEEAAITLPVDQEMALAEKEKVCI